jgi:hypothetical protein
MPLNVWARDVFIEGLNARMEPGPLMQMAIDNMPEEPPGGWPIVWYRALPDHEIDMELVGNWVEPEYDDLWDDGW